MRPTRRTLSLAAVAALALGAASAATAGAGPAAPPASTFYVGAAVESIDPTQAMIDSGEFYLGGYGLSSGKALNNKDLSVMDGRYATGILHDPLLPSGDGDGVHVRAFVVGDGARSIALAQIETQGYFAAYKQGPFGIVDIRKDAAAEIAALGGPAMGPGQILVDSNHTHAGPDTAGVWGGVQTDYLTLVHDQAVKAIVEAYRAQQPVDLVYGVSHAGVDGLESTYPAPDGDPLLTDQFRKDPLNQVVDDELRVLQARKPGTSEVVATYLNYSSHPTVLGGGNTLVSADYTGPLSAMLSTLGGTGFQQVGTLGRTQPARDGQCLFDQLKATPDVCKIHTYADRVFRRAQLAIAGAQPVGGPVQVDLHSFLIQDPATNAPIVALSYGGFVAGAPIYRSVAPPWFVGNELGAPVFSGRIGDLLVNGGPGEVYPQVFARVRASVPGIRGSLNIGTAGDFLGYIIAPVEAYPEPLRSSFFDGEAPPAGNDCSGVPSPVGCPSPIDNDNYFFNVSHTFGERLTCSLLRGAGEVLAGDAMAYWGGYERCPAFANDLVLPADVDTTFPAQPDLSALPVYQH